MCMSVDNQMLKNLVIFHQIFVETYFKIYGQCYIKMISLLSRYRCVHKSPQILGKSRKMISIRAQLPHHEDNESEDTKANRAKLERLYNENKKKTNLFSFFQNKIIDKGYVEMKEENTESDSKKDMFHEITENTKDFIVRTTTLIQLGLTFVPTLALPGAIILVTIITYIIFGEDFVHIGTL